MRQRSRALRLLRPKESNLNPAGRVITHRANATRADRRHSHQSGAGADDRSSIESVPANCPCSRFLCFFVAMLDFPRSSDSRKLKLERGTKCPGHSSSLPHYCLHHLRSQVLPSRSKTTRNAVALSNSSRKRSTPKHCPFSRSWLLRILT